MNPQPTALNFFGSFAQINQILKLSALPLYESHQLKDPFIPTKTMTIEFNRTEMLESTIRRMVGLILSKSSPKGNPNHPMQKVIRRWRSEERFESEKDIRTALESLLPTVVEQNYHQAETYYEDLRQFIENQRIVRFFDNLNDIQLWNSEAQHYTGAVIRFDFSDNESFMSQLHPANYPTTPAKVLALTATLSVISCRQLVGHGV